MARHGKAFTMLHLTNAANSASIVMEIVQRNRSLHDLIIVFPEYSCLLGCHSCTFEDSSLRTSHLQFLPAWSHQMKHLKYHKYPKSLLELPNGLGKDNMKFQFEQSAAELLECACLHNVSAFTKIKSHCSKMVLKTRWTWKSSGNP